MSSDGELKYIIEVMNKALFITIVNNHSGQIIFNLEFMRK